MFKYVLKRVLISVVTVLIILAVLFTMLHSMPGSPFNDEKITAVQRANLEAKYGLDKPLPVQFVNYLKAMLSGDFGVSYVIQKNMPIASLLRARIMVSIRIGVQAVALGTLIGLLMGIVAAMKRNSFLDTFATVVSVIGVAFPSYVFAMAMSYFIGFRLGWLPLLYSTADAAPASARNSAALIHPGRRIMQKATMYNTCPRANIAPPSGAFLYRPEVFLWHLKR